MGEMVSILDGNAFVVSDKRGDVEATPTDTSGFFLNDTRFLSRWILTIDGMRPTVMSVDDLDYYRVQFFQAHSTGDVYVNSHLSCARQRSVGRGFHDDITLWNHSKDPMDLEMKIEADNDFADLFEVKDKLTKKGTFYRRVEGKTLVLGYKRDTYHRQTRITAPTATEVREDGFTFKVRLESHGGTTFPIDVEAVMWPDHPEQGADLRPAPKKKEAAAPKKGTEPPKQMTLSPGNPESAENVREWCDSAPRIRSSWSPLEHTYQRSIVDLAALRFRTPFAKGALPAAGLPWFMALFGRDSLITSFQALPFNSELAATTLRTLALLQGRVDDAFRDEEPGKILHELRLGELTAFEERPHSPYYGAADSTPLFLILLEEYERWTRDTELVRRMERVARGACDWIDQFGDRDGDGYVEYERRMPTGLDNQCWKDSWDSIAFADGTIAKTPRATCEIQGYVYDAKRRTARLARELWGDEGWAARLERQAADLKRRFNQDFWIPERGFFALALDGRKAKVDSLTSNIGHLLWSGICDKDKADSCVKHLMSDALFSGWGVRTMAVGEGSYNPIGYHVGTIWPHDNSMIAWGLRTAGYKAEAARIARGILEAAELFHHRLPEAFSGYAREATKFPVEYPTACSPQAWATGAPLLLLRALLGLDSDGKHLIIDPAMSEPISQLELLDIPGCWGRMDAFGRARLAA
jgi:glycogen debranching enzyme